MRAAPRPHLGRRPRRRWHERPDALSTGRSAAGRALPPDLLRCARRKPPCKMRRRSSRRSRAP
eukprot:12626111-Alexandrium_andersonii.AAC.1